MPVMMISMLMFSCACAFMQHDATVAAFLSAMEIFNDLTPPYVSSVLVELFNSSGHFFVKVWYRNDSAPSAEPFPLTIPGECCIIYPCW